MLAKQFSNLENNEIKHKDVFKGHKQGVEKVEFLKQNPQRFISCSHDNSVKVWDINKVQEIQTFDHIHENGVWDFVQDNQTNSLFTISPDSKLIQTDLRNGQCVNTLNIDMEKGYTISHQNNQILIGGQNGQLTLLDERKVQILQQIPFLEQIVYKTQPFQNNNWIISTSSGNIHIFDNNLNEICNKKLVDKEIRTFTSFQDNLYLSCEKHKILKYKINIEDKQISKISENDGHLDEIRCFQIDGEKNLLFTGCSDSSLFVWDLESMNFKNNFIGHKDLVSSIDISNSLQLLISGSWDQNCMSFDIQNINHNQVFYLQ